MHIRKGDKVVVIKGRDRGKSGLVIDVNLDKKRVRIEGLNIQKRHMKKSSRTGAAGGVTEVAGLIPAANVMVVDPNTGKATRVGHKLVGDKKVRITKKSQSIIEDVKR